MRQLAPLADAESANMLTIARKRVNTAAASQPPLLPAWTASDTIYSAVVISVFDGSPSIVHCRSVLHTLKSSGAWSLSPQFQPAAGAYFSGRGCGQLTEFACLLNSLE